MRLLALFFLAGREKDVEITEKALLLLALSPSPAATQRPPQPDFTELIAYDPTASSQLLRSGYSPSA